MYLSHDANKWKRATRDYYRHSAVCYVIYDITDRNSFVQVQKHVKFFSGYYQGVWGDRKETKLEKNNLRLFSTAIIVVVGNKVDLNKNRRVSTEMISHF